jgi:hypothetical protein
MIVSDDSAASVIAKHRDLAGELLSPQVAAVELLNVLRPIVAVGVYLTFGALALHRYPLCRQQLQTIPDDYPYLFAQEVRRFYPFFPAVCAEVGTISNGTNTAFRRARPRSSTCTEPITTLGLGPILTSFSPSGFATGTAILTTSSRTAVATTT